MMKRKLFLMMLCCGLWVLSILAHEFWIEPDRTNVKVGETIRIELVVGENFKGERWQGKGDRITMYKHRTAGGAIDLLNSIDPLTVTKLHDFTPVTEGTHVLSLETNHSFIELEADEFEAYLREDGLEQALVYRQQHGEQQMKGRERYKRCTKLIVQAGEELDQAFKQPAYMTIEIIPVDHPCKRKEDKPVAFKVLFENKPLADAKVRCWYKSATDSNVQIQVSNKKGEVSFEQNREGLYMISVVHMVRVQNDPKVDWESTWGSLVFGFGDQ